MKIAAIAALEPHGDRNTVTRLVHREGYRLRVGDWRVIFTVTQERLDLLAVGPRSGVYDD